MGHASMTRICHMKQRTTENTEFFSVLSMPRRKRDKTELHRRVHRDEGPV